MNPIRIKSSDRVCFHPDGNRLLSYGRQVNLWSIEDRRKLWTTHPFSHPSSGAFSPDGIRIVMKNTQGRIVVIDVSTGDLMVDFRNQMEGEGSNVLFSRDGNELIDGSWGGFLTVRDSRSGEIRIQSEFPGEAVSRIHFRGVDGPLISEHHPKATTHDQPPPDCYFMEWSWPFTSRRMRQLPIARPFIMSSAVSNCGNRLAVVYGGRPSRMDLLELESGSVIWSKEVDVGGSGSAVQWSPCGNFLVAVQRKSITIYHARDGSLHQTRQFEYPSDIAFSPDASMIAYGSWTHGIIESFPYETGERSDTGLENS